MKKKKIIEKLRSFLLVNVIVLAVLLVAPLNGGKASVFSCSQENGNYSSKGNITLPVIRVQNIILPENELEEGKMIDISVVIENKDTTPLPDLQLVVALTEIIDSRSKDPTTTTFNKTLGIIPATSTITDHVSFTEKFGEYLLTACLAFEDKIIPESAFSTQIQILGPPIGDIPSLLYALGGIFGFIFVIALFPAIIDRFRYKSKNNHHEDF